MQGRRVSSELLDLGILIYGALTTASAAVDRWVYLSAAQNVGLRTTAAGFNPPASHTGVSGAKITVGSSSTRQSSSRFRKSMWQAQKP